MRCEDCYHDTCIHLQMQLIWLHTAMQSQCIYCASCCTVLWRCKWMGHTEQHALTCMMICSRSQRAHVISYSYSPNVLCLNIKLGLKRHQAATPKHSLAALYPVQRMQHRPHMFLGMPSLTYQREPSLSKERGKRRTSKPATRSSALEATTPANAAAGLLIQTMGLACNHLCLTFLSRSIWAKKVRTDRGDGKGDQGVENNGGGCEASKGGATLVGQDAGY